MASELKFTATVTYTDAAGRTRSVQVPELFGDTTKTAVFTQTIATSETALKLADITSPTALMIVNIDPTNFVNVKVATGGAIFAKLAKDANGDGNGGFLLLSALGTGAQAPYLIADTGACDVLVLIAE